MAYQQRLLKDVHETQTKPYPNIHFVWDTANNGSLSNACLILTPENTKNIHLTLEVPPTFPLKPPTIWCDSLVVHPNVMSDYICASILNTDEGWTPAYTLRGVAIQILSFFSSEHLEQEHGGPAINIQDYAKGFNDLRKDCFMCDKCGFNRPIEGHPTLYPASIAWNSSWRSIYTLSAAVNNLVIAASDAAAPSNAAPALTKDTSANTINELPHELLAQICDRLEDEDLVNFTKAWNTIGGATGVVTRFNIIRNRELLCFTLKKSFREAKLGIGISIDIKGRKGTLESEFELISLEVFKDLRVRKSVHGLSFDHWLPVPLSARHYMIIKAEVFLRLDMLNDTARRKIRCKIRYVYLVGYTVDPKYIALSYIEPYF